MSLIIILFIVMLVIFSILWGNRTFSVKTLNQMFYHMIVPCDGTEFLRIGLLIVFHQLL